MTTIVYVFDLLVLVLALVIWGFDWNSEDVQQ